MRAPAAVGGNRLAWHELPADLREAVKDAAGAPVRAATSQPGGFSPGLASVLYLADGRSVFLKAVSSARNSQSPAMHRREAEVLASLPAQVPAPRLLWSYDDGDWVALMTEAVDGVPPAQPWRRHELDAFVEVAARLVAVLTPAPAATPAHPDITTRYADAFTGWRKLAAEPRGEDLLRRAVHGARRDGAGRDGAGRDGAGRAGARRMLGWARRGDAAWAGRHLDRLAAIEATWPAAAAGDTLLHADLRADNVLLTPDGAVVVDWPHACVGAGWVDFLFAVPSLSMQGAGEPEALWRRFEPGRLADPEAVTSMLSAATGYFLWQGSQPPPQNLPTVRAFQLAQGRAALRWLRQRLSARMAGAV